MKTSICSAKNLLVIGLAIVLGITFQSCGKNDEPEIVTPPDNGEENVSECPGALSGVFSVSATKKVRFSKANLYYDGSKFMFDSNQYHFEGNWRIWDGCYFFWTKDASVACAEEYNDPGASDSNEFFTNADGFTVNVEGKEQSGWRTLSAAEWEYLFKNHSYKWVTVLGVAGYVIAPDNFAGTLAASYANDAALETDNLLFLPAAGRRNGSTTLGGDIGYYWSSSVMDENNAYCVGFYEGGVNPDIYEYRYWGLSVRLVTDCQ